MIKIGYYPGCSLLGSSREYDESLRAIIAHMGFELVPVPDWNCCGASSAHVLNHDLAVSLPARVLALAETLDVDTMLVPCAACWHRLVDARHQLAEDSALRTRIIDMISMNYTGRVQPLNILEFLEHHAPTYKDKITTPFKRNVACYYGCLLVRPPNVVTCDRSEDPMSMDAIMATLGATPVDWAFKVECCGAGHSIARTDLVGKLSAKIVTNAVKRGAEAIIVACPMCHSNLDMRRNVINTAANQDFKLPVIYITQAIGLALGINEKTLGLHRHIVDVCFPEQTEKA